MAAVAAVAVVEYSVVRRTMIAVGGGVEGTGISVELSSVGGGSTQSDGGSLEDLPLRRSS